jgi:hypothetical protein
MRNLAALFLIVLVASGGVFAGCLDAQNPEAPVAPAAPQSLEARVMKVLEATPPIPGYKRLDAIAWWESFVKTYAGRQWGAPKNAEAAAFLQSELTKAGYQAETLIMKAPVTGLVPGVPVQGDFRIVRGLKMGVDNPQHRIALISHYDIIQGTTVQGAYDDGAGVAVEMEICKTLGRVPTNKTIECIFFDGEEMGLVASSAYVNDYAKGGKDYVYDQAFGYDMTGLNWPGHPDWKLYALLGLTQHEKLTEEMQVGHQKFLNTTFYKFMGQGMGVTDKGVVIKLRNHRNSDEQRFEKVLGVPVVRFAGGYNPNWYPMYHRTGDTIEYVYNFACGNCTATDPQGGLVKGRELFSRGMEMVTTVSYYTIMAYDKFDSYQIVA